MKIDKASEEEKFKNEMNEIDGLLEESNKLLEKVEEVKSKNKVDEILDEGKSENDLAWEEIERNFEEEDEIMRKAREDSSTGTSSIWSLVAALILLPFALVAFSLLIFAIIFVIFVGGVSGKS